MSRGLFSALSALTLVTGILTPTQELPSSIFGSVATSNKPN